MQQSNPPIPRQRLLNRTLQYIEEAPVTVLPGARQTGKTTAILFDIIDPI